MQLSLLGLLPRWLSSWSLDSGFWCHLWWCLARSLRSLRLRGRKDSPARGFGYWLEGTTAILFIFAILARVSKSEDSINLRSSNILRTEHMNRDIRGSSLCVQPRFSLRHMPSSTSILFSILRYRIDYVIGSRV